MVQYIPPTKSMEVSLRPSTVSACSIQPASGCVGEAITTLYAKYDPSISLHRCQMGVGNAAIANIVPTVI